MARLGNTEPSMSARPPLPGERLRRTGGTHVIGAADRPTDPPMVAAMVPMRPSEKLRWIRVDDTRG